MYYELYIDVFFLVNFMMDYILLSVVRKVLKCPATHGSVCLGAMLGAFLTCVIIVLPIPYAFVKFILFHGFVNIVMIKTGLRARWDRSFLKAFVLLYISGFLVGGVFTYLHQYVRYASLFFVLAVASYYLVLGIWNVISYLARHDHYRCEVILYQADRKVKVRAVIDTGNSLRDNVTGKPVSVIAAKTAKELWGGKAVESVRYIPYHTIGKAEGVLPVFPVDKMCLCREEEKMIEKPLVAVSEEPITADGYELILNPDIL